MKVKGRNISNTTDRRAGDNIPCKGEQQTRQQKQQVQQASKADVHVMSGHDMIALFIIFGWHYCDFKDGKQPGDRGQFGGGEDEPG